jgi:AcrR family transcriptional regulator
MTELEEQGRTASRATEATRAALLKAATVVFSEKGYGGASVRHITQKADANQAAINYHFGGKEQLYRAVLEVARDTLANESALDADELDALSPELALRSYLRQFLSPLVKRDRVSRYMRIFSWEAVQPTSVFQEFIKGSPPRVFTLARRVVRRFLPVDASAEEVEIATMWLAQQPMFFLRDAERLASGPVAMKFDDAMLERLVETLTRLNLGGLAACADPLNTSGSRKS